MSNHIEKVKNTLYNRVLEISQPDSLPQNISILMFGHWNTDFQKWVKFKNVSAPPCIITDFINLVSVDFSLYALGIISVLFLKPKLKKKKKKKQWNIHSIEISKYLFFFFLLGIFHYFSVIFFNFEKFISRHLCPSITHCLLSIVNLLSWSHSYSKSHYGKGPRMTYRFQLISIDNWYVISVNCIQ